MHQSRNTSTRIRRNKMSAKHFSQRHRKILQLWNTAIHFFKHLVFQTSMLGIYWFYCFWYWPLHNRYKLYQNILSSQSVTAFKDTIVLAKYTLDLSNVGSSTFHCHKSEIHVCFMCVSQWVKGKISSTIKP